MRGAARRLDARRRWSRAPSPLPPLSPLTTHIDDVVDDDDDDDIYIMMKCLCVCL